MRLSPLKVFSLLFAGASALLAPSGTAGQTTGFPKRDLTVVFSPLIMPAKVGSFLFLWMHVTNHGPASDENGLPNPVSAPELFFTTPPGARAVEISPTACFFFPGSCSTSSLAYVLPPLRLHESTTFLVAVQPLIPGLLIFSARVSLSLVTPTTDPNPFNNIDTLYVWAE